MTTEGRWCLYLDWFAKSLDEQGFRGFFSAGRLRVAADLSKMASGRGKLARRDVTDELYGVSSELCTTAVGPAWRVRHAAGGSWISLVSWASSPLPEHEEATAIQQTVSAFAAYLRQERALSEKTLIQFARSSNASCPSASTIGPVEFAALRAGDVIGFVKRRAASLSPARAKAATTALRSFFATCAIAVRPNSISPLRFQRCPIGQ